MKLNNDKKIRTTVELKDKMAETLLKRKKIYHNTDESNAYQIFVDLQCLYLLIEKTFNTLRKKVTNIDYLLALYRVTDYFMLQDAVMDDNIDMSLKELRIKKEFEISNDDIKSILNLIKSLTPFEEYVLLLKLSECAPVNNVSYKMPSNLDEQKRLKFIDAEIKKNISNAFLIE